MAVWSGPNIGTQQHSRTAQIYQNGYTTNTAKGTKQVRIKKKLTKVISLSEDIIIIRECSISNLAQVELNQDTNVRVRTRLRVTVEKTH